MCCDNLTGVSTASLYPLETEKALLTLAELGVSTTEIFFNSLRELKGEILKEIINTINSFHLKISSVHPFSSPMETLFLFSTYERRVLDMIDMYQQYFEFMSNVGADVFVIHGVIKSNYCEESLYFNNFNRLAELGSQFGVRVAQENVCYCKSSDPDFLRRMKQQLGDNARFVLDLKQARRSSVSPLELITSLGNSIVHCHVSDGKDKLDCLPIGKGDFDFLQLIRQFNSVGYDGRYIVELYRQNYADYQELRNSQKKLAELLEKA